MMSMLDTRVPPSVKVYITICTITFEIMHFFTTLQIATSAILKGQYRGLDAFGYYWLIAEIVILSCISPVDAGLIT